MEFKTYKVKQGGYHEIYDSTVTLPSNLELITGGLDDVGEHKYSELYHYFGIIEGNADTLDKKIDGVTVQIYQFSKYCFITIHDIKFIDNSPTIITTDELNSKYDLSKYYITYWSKDYDLIGMSKIKKINSEFDIDVLQVYRKYFYVSEENNKLLHINNVRFSDLGFDNIRNFTIKINQGSIAKQYWNYLINDITKEYGINKKIKNIDIDYIMELNNINCKLFDIISNNKAEESDYITFTDNVKDMKKYLNMKKVKYIS